MPLALQNINGIHVAAFSGTLDNSAGADLVSGIKTSVEKGAKIVLDCTLLAAMDVAGFKHLLALHRWSQVNNGRLVLAGMSPEAWSLVVENHCENTFEAYPSVPAAFNALGVDDQPTAQAGDGGGYADYPEPPPFGGEPTTPEPDYSQTFNYSSVGSTADPWGSPPPIPGAGPATSSWDTEPAPSVTGEWDRWGSSPPPIPGQPEETSGKKTKAKWPLWVALAAVLGLLVWGGIWLMDYLKEPEISLSESMIVVEEGKEPPDVIITVHNGVLADDDLETPEDLFVDGPDDENAEPKIYHLTGVLKAGARDATLEFKAKRGERFSEPKSLEVVAKPAPLEWLFQPPPLKAGQTLLDYSKIAKGARRITLRWSPKDPGGLESKQDPRNPGQWSLEGNPAEAGKFKVEFTAEDMAGASHTKGWDVVIAGEPKPLPPPATLQWNPEIRSLALQEKEKVGGAATVVSGADTLIFAWQPKDPGLSVKQAVGTTNWYLDGTPEIPGEFQLSVTATPKGGAPEVQNIAITVAAKPNRDDSRPASATTPLPGIDDQMRTFLLERIEMAGEHFTDEDKQNLRLMVSLLTDARKVAVVTFGTGKTNLTEREMRKLKSALKDTGAKELLENKDCEILVVGYASPSGSRATNVRLSRERAKSVKAVIAELGYEVDLCGDYGPTTVLSEDQLGNQAVEVFIGKIDIPDALERVAERFKDDFNARHGR